VTAGVVGAASVGNEVALATVDGWEVAEAEVEAPALGEGEMPTDGPQPARMMSEARTAQRRAASVLGT
jgi:hypothetical protein